MVDTSDKSLTANIAINPIAEVSTNSNIVNEGLVNGSALVSNATTWTATNIPTTSTTQSPLRHIATTVSYRTPNQHLDENYSCNEFPQQSPVVSDLRNYQPQVPGYIVPQSQPHAVYAGVNYAPQVTSSMAFNMTPPILSSTNYYSSYNPLGHYAQPVQPAGLHSQSFPVSSMPTTTTGLQTTAASFMTTPIQAAFRPTLPSAVPTTTYNMLNNTSCFELTSTQIASRQVLSRDLPIFSGKPEEWPMFITNFEQSTQRCGFTDQENLIRLQKCLRGAALEAVRGKLMLPAMVRFVIGTLKMLYGNPDTIHRVLQTKLRQTPGVCPQKLDTLINLALAVQNFRATMQTIGLSAYLNDPTLLNDLLAKLPPNLRLEWGKQCVLLNTVNIEIFDDWLFNYATYASRVTSFEPTSYYNMESKQIGKRTKERILVHDVTSIIKECPKCASDHSLNKCPEFTAMSRRARWGFVREKRLCVCCFGNHYVNRCDSKQKCGVDECTQKHNALLHSNNQNRSNDISKGDSASNNYENSVKMTTENSNSVLFHNQFKTLFRYLPVKVYGETKVIETYALIDEGAACTLMDADFASQLKLQGPEEELCLKWTGNVTQNEPRSRRLSLGISSREKNAQSYIMKNVRTVKNLNLPEQTLESDVFKKRKHLCDLPIEPYTNVRAHILIGLDNMKVGVPLEIREAEGDDLVGTRCRLGWSVYGRRDAARIDKTQVLHLCECNEPRGDQHLDALVKEYFAIEAIGIKETNPLRSKEDERSLDIMERTSRFLADEKRWEVGLLWKNDRVILPDSYNMALKRLHCLEAKMARDATLKEFLIKTIRSHEEKGYVRRISDKVTPDDKSWYIPIFTVTNPNKNKVRLVWDAAAKVHDVSLNSFLMKGPDLLTSLPGILIRFRERPFAISGDIREMFHQIKVRKEDQTAQKFLWRDGNLDKPPHVYIMQVMTFGASCSPSLANFIKNKNADRFVSIYPVAVSAIHQNTFVDDWLQSTNSEAEMIELAANVRKIHQAGGFEMRNWASNSENVLRSLVSTYDNPVNMHLDPSNNSTEKILGMWWVPHSDKIVFNFNLNDKIIACDTSTTKRQILRIIMRIFDPLGLLGFYVIGAKILLQDIWRSGVSWDGPVEESDQITWREWLQLLPELKKLQIPRSLGLSNYIKQVELHVFVDASIKAYAAVAYIRTVINEVTCCNIVASKTRVAPLKPISVPRLELMAAILGLRLAKFVEHEASIKITRRRFWSDSKDVLFWIRSDARKFPQFVALRIGEILEGSNIQEWQWVPSRLNVADEGTKFNKSLNFRDDLRWFKGPEFLLQPEDKWPSMSNNKITAILHSADVYPISGTLRSIFPDPTRFSKWERLRGTQKFVNLYLKRSLRNIKGSSTVDYLKRLDGVKGAETLIIRCCQEEMFSEDIKNLTEPNKHISNKSKLFKYSPYLDDFGLLRVRGRIDAIEGVHVNVKRPIILPRKHQVAYLLADFYHRRYQHCHNEIVINEMRQRFAIPGLRALVREVSKSCQLCKNRHAFAQPPEMGNLPMERLQAYTRPFAFTGIDCFGPLDIIVGRHHEKRYGVLFTCLTVRAVHIEVASSLSTDAFLLAFKQFVNRRGVPNRIMSDNATNFRGASRVLQQEMQKTSFNEIKQKFPDIEWEFIPPASPHMGGSWERMIRSVKSIMMEVLPETGVREEVLRAALTDIENILNSRPLTYVPIDSAEAEALTPNSLIIGTTSGWHEKSSYDDSGNALRKYFRISSQLAERFWKRWLKECLPELTRRSKWYQPVTPLAIDDVVIIIDEQAKRNTWTKGVVVDISRASDGQVRSAVVKTANGLSTRPAVKLARLDVCKPHSEAA